MSKSEVDMIIPSIIKKMLEILDYSNFKEDLEYLNQMVLSIVNFIQLTLLILNKRKKIYLQIDRFLDHKVVIQYFRNKIILIIYQDLTMMSI
jgi:hypothetical protein